VADDARNRPLLVSGFIATRQGDPERGPQVRMAPDDARARLLLDGELAWVHGPRRQELATVSYDAAVRKGDVVLRDVLGASISELVRVIKPDLDSHTRRGNFA
jgi:anaerobic selenocysteine-containing dehydrogenase